MKNLRIETTSENLEIVNAFIEKELENLECSPKKSMEILVSIEEIYVNIVHYAYDGNTGFADITFDYNNGSVFITFTDEGIEFNPLKKEDPDITVPIGERPIGGLGIFMVKKTMDSVDYKRIDGKNILTISKNIN